MAPFLAMAETKQAFFCSSGLEKIFSYVATTSFIFREKDRLDSLTLAKVAIFSENETKIAQLMPYVCKINGRTDLVFGSKKK